METEVSTKAWPAFSVLNSRSHRALHARWKARSAGKGRQPKPREMSESIDMSTNAEGQDTQGIDQEVET
jgi:hypothetical protein